MTFTPVLDGVNWKLAPCFCFVLSLFEQAQLCHLLRQGVLVIYNHERVSSRSWHNNDGFGQSPFITHLMSHDVAERRHGPPISTKYMYLLVHGKHSHMHSFSVSVTLLIQKDSK